MKKYSKVVRCFFIGLIASFMLAILGVLKVANYPRSTGGMFIANFLTIFSTSWAVSAFIGAMNKAHFHDTKKVEPKNFN